MALLGSSPDALDLFSPITKRWRMTLACAVTTLLATRHVCAHDHIMMCSTVTLLVLADAELASQVLAIHDVGDVINT